MGARKSRSLKLKSKLTTHTQTERQTDRQTDREGQTERDKELGTHAGVVRQQLVPGRTDARVVAFSITTSADSTQMTVR